MGRINWGDIQSAAFPAGQVNPTALLRGADGILSCYGNAVPVDGEAGYATGCVLHHVDGSGDSSLYVNQGVKTSCAFVKLDKVPNAYGTATGRGPSPAIWNDCPVLEYTLNPQAGFHYFEDFKGDVYGTTNTTTRTQRGLTFFNDNGPTHQIVDDDVHGVLRVEGNDADNDDSVMAFGHDGGIMKLASGKKFWFECRVRKDTVDDNELGFFIGFAQEGLCAADTLDVDTAEFVAAKDVLGFLNKLDDGNAIDFVHGDGVGEVAEKKAGICVPTASAWNKLGLKCDGLTITPYVDGVAKSDTITINDSDVPLGEEMALYWAVKNGDAAPAEHKASIDWWRFAQSY